MLTMLRLTAECHDSSRCLGVCQHNMVVNPRRQFPGFQHSLQFLHNYLRTMLHLSKLSRKKRIAARAAPGEGRQRRTYNIRRLWHSNRRQKQDIAVVDIDPEKLMTKLKAKYGSEFQVHVRALSYVTRLKSANTKGCR